jgi:small subunit ribosomal protein S20
MFWRDKKTDKMPQKPPDSAFSFERVWKILWPDFCKSAKSAYLCTPILQKDMANHKSAEKRIRANDAKRVRNRYQHKTTRTAIKNLRSATVKSEAVALLKEVSSMIDKLAKKNVIHWKKAANQKSKLTKHVNKLA